ncbi:MAG TPA: isopentenyl-diphosphate delta-isomerase [Candidatus Thalassarchaeaceae archaeon]|nr:isopentenyl-diphosphate delta-isomerase [Candidatus Thalassarchaeaceae archaeon]
MAMTGREDSWDRHDGSQAQMMEEMCIVVDSNNRVIDSKSKLECHHGSGVLHRAFSVLLFDGDGKLLVQRRSPEKITFPGVWANSCCSHPLDIEGENGDAREGAINAAIRKLEQELGVPSEISDKWDFQNLGVLEYSCRWNTEWIEREMDYVISVIADIDVSPNKNEIVETLWLDPTEVEEMISGAGIWGDRVVAPWFKLIWEEFIRPNNCDPIALSQTYYEHIKYCGEVNMSGEKVVSTGNLMDALSKHRDRVEEEIMSSLGRTKQRRLNGAMTHLFKGGGKRLRAILPRLVGEAVGDANDGHYTLGASIEIIHNFTLIHDDIVDNDPIRRGLNAVHVEFDQATAINAGDAMLAVGFEILAESDFISAENLRLLISSIGEMVRVVAAGQQQDLEFESKDDVDEEEYMEMISGKTSAMFETCAKTGSILANANQETIEIMSKWGLNLGLCFQLMDDLIDITGDTATIGKRAGSDVIQGKMTLIAIHARNSGLELPNFQLAFGDEGCSEEVLSLAVKELMDSGSIGYARGRALHHHRIAHECLDEIPDSDALALLKEITDFQLVRIN